MSRRGCNISLACGAMLLGGILYIYFRGTTYIALFFRSIPVIGKVLQDTPTPSCEFFSFYFPDFLWAFSLCCLLNAIHLPHRTGIWLCGIVAFFAGVLWELLQYTHTVSGTGDLLDIFAYLSAAMLSTIINLGGREYEKT